MAGVPVRRLQLAAAAASMTVSEDGARRFKFLSVSEEDMDGKMGRREENLQDPNSSSKTAESPFGLFQVTQRDGRFYSKRPTYDELQPQWNPRMSRIYADTLNNWQQKSRYRSENRRVNVPLNRIAMDFEDEITPLKRSVEVIQGEVNDMQAEISNQQKLINAWKHVHVHTHPAVSSSPELHFKVPGPIEIDHLSLPGGSYSLSLSDKSTGSMATLHSGGRQYQVSLHKASPKDARNSLPRDHRSEAKQEVRRYLQHRAKALEALRSHQSAASIHPTDKRHLSRSVGSMKVLKERSNVEQSAIQKLRRKLSKELHNEEAETKVLEEATRLKAQAAAKEAQDAKLSSSHFSDAVGKEAKDIIAKLLSKDLRLKRSKLANVHSIGTNGGNQGQTSISDPHLQLIDEVDRALKSQIRNFRK
eukprot:752921-Hanusia_phi.AAC.2